MAKTWRWLLEVELVKTASWSVGPGWHIPAGGRAVCHPILD